MAKMMTLFRTETLLELAGQMCRTAGAIEKAYEDGLLTRNIRNRARHNMLLALRDAIAGPPESVDE